MPFQLQLCIDIFLREGREKRNDSAKWRVFFSFINEANVPARFLYRIPFMQICPPADEP